MSRPRLELLRVEHLPAVANMIADREVVRFTPFPEEPPPGFIDDWYARYVAGRAAGTAEVFAILDGSGTFLGLAMARTIDTAALTMELGYVVASEARGRGVATYALASLVEWAFGGGIRRAELQIHVDNIASKAVARRCFFHYEGTLRSRYVRPGQRADIEMWSRLPGDPTEWERESTCSIS